MHIETINVDQAWRKQGVATAMLEKALEKAREIKYVSFAFAWPAFLNHNIPDSLPEEEQKTRRDSDEATSVALFRKAGYRRVGSSVWFCLSLDPSHPSRNISLDEDYDPPDDPVALSELEKHEEALEL